MFTEPKTDASHHTVAIPRLLHDLFTTHLDRYVDDNPEAPLVITAPLSGDTPPPLQLAAGLGPGPPHGGGAGSPVP